MQPSLCWLLLLACSVVRFRDMWRLLLTAGGLLTGFGQPVILPWLQRAPAAQALVKSMRI